MSDKKVGLEIPIDWIHIGRVLHEDDNFVTMEVPKHNRVTFQVIDGDHFYSFICLDFQLDEPEHSIRFCNPWEEPDE